MKNKTLLLIIFSLIWNNLYSQVPSIKEYIIITFEKTVNKYSVDGTKNYFWIMPVDSFYDNQHFLISPLFIDAISKNDLESCCKGKRIDPFIMTTASKYNFDTNHINQINQLKIILRSKRRKIQDIFKKWTGGYIEEIKIYATPVLGSFCSCSLREETKTEVGYNGLVFIPLNSFSIIHNFEESKKFKYIIFSDYSKIDFEIKPSF